MKTRYKNYFVGLVCTIVLLMQPTIDTFARTTEKKLSISTLLRQQKNDSLISIEMVGRIQHDAAPLDEVTVTVYADSVEILSTTSNRGGKCKFILPVGSKYTIVFSASGYLTKKIRLNAKISDMGTTRSAFHFTVDMKEDSKGFARGK